MTGAGLFANWCALHGYPAYPPVLPAMVAKFIADCKEFGIEKLWPAVRELSQAHIAAGLADPTAGGVVAGAINSIANINPPRGWPDAEKVRFLSLPYDLQVYFAGHEAAREREIHRAHNEAAKARKELAAIQQPKVTDGDRPNDTACGAN